MPCQQGNHLLVSARHDQNARRRKQTLELVSVQNAIIRRPMQNPNPHDICTSPSSYNCQSSEGSTFLNLVLLSVERTPNTSHTLVQTLHLLGLPLELLAARVAQQHCLLHNLVGLHVAHTDGLLLSADVFALHDGVAAGSGRD